jgi:hypothetical protein
MSIAVFSVVWAIVSSIIAVGVFFASVVVEQARRK